VLKIRHIAKPKTVTGNGITTVHKTIFRADNELTKNFGKAVWLSLRKIKRAAKPPTSRPKLQHILFCPTTPHRQFD